MTNLGVITNTVSWIKSKTLQSATLVREDFMEVVGLHLIIQKIENRELTVLGAGDSKLLSTKEQIIR